MRYFIFMIILACIGSCSTYKSGELQKVGNKMVTNRLTDIERYVMEQKGTERPFTGEYYDFFEEGTYVCKRCGTALYRSKDKFRSGCGWPSFDDEIKGAVRRLLDADGRRTEIQCAKCGAHLGHVFIGEGFTPKDTRHCVNSVSLKFVPLKKKYSNMKEIYFAGGCFWGTEHYFKQLRGVVDTKVGYANGNTDNPTYREVCTDKTGFAETVRVVYDPDVITLEFLTEMYFRAIDPTSVDQQGPDIGSQYRTGIYYKDDADKAEIRKVYDSMRQKLGSRMAVEFLPLKNFYYAEEYHQDYLDKNPAGYCHLPSSLFRMAKEANVRR